MVDPPVYTVTLNMGATNSRVADGFSSVATYTWEPLAFLFTPGANGSVKAIELQRNAVMLSEVEALKAKLEERDENVARAKRHVGAAQEELNVAQRKLSLLSQEAEEWKRRCQAAQISSEAQQEANAGLQNNLRRQERLIKTAADELQLLQDQHRQTLALLETRTIELKGAQAFLNKSSSLAGADIIRMVEALNSEILQNAAYLADSFVFGPQDEIDSNLGDQMDEICDSASRSIGLDVVQYLRTHDHEDPMFVQIALQACMVEFAR